jgi:hypothetical protein
MSNSDENGEYLRHHGANGGGGQQHHQTQQTQTNHHNHHHSHQTQNVSTSTTSTLNRRRSSYGHTHYTTQLSCTPINFNDAGPVETQNYSSSNQLSPTRYISSEAYR